MATLYIAEYANIPEAAAGQPMQIAGDEITTQTVTYSTTAQSAAFNGKTRYIAITSPGIFSYAIGASPTATTSKFRIPADAIIYLKVNPGDKIAAVTNT
jgi:hypothetical protein